MKNKISVLAILFTYTFSIGQSFDHPIEGEYGKDYIIVNYIDWGVNGITDFHKGTKTYPGHRGTDFVISGFPQMDEGVFVNAVDSGVVTFVHDGEIDRNTDGNINLGFGNYIAIRHPSNLYSYYAHLKKNSMLVNVGDKVSKGEHLALVGSSGNSTDPHLHFELWYDSLYLVEPFAASCGEDNSFWEEPMPYDTTFNVWESGLTDFITNINDIRNRPIAKDTFNDQDSIVNYWTLQYGIKTGDSTRIEWITPNGSLWFEYSNVYQNDWWLYYYNSYIFAPPTSVWGDWKCNYYYNDKLVDSANFTVEKPDGTNETNELSYYKLIDKHSIEVILPESISANAVEVFGISGKKILHQNLNSGNKFIIKIPKQQNNQEVFLIKVKHSKGYWNFKVVL